MAAIKCPFPQMYNLIILFASENDNKIPGFQKSYGLNDAIFNNRFSALSKSHEVQTQFAAPHTATMKGTYADVLLNTRNKKSSLLESHLGNISSPPIILYNPGTLVLSARTRYGRHLFRA